MQDCARSEGMGLPVPQVMTVMRSGANSSASMAVACFAAALATASATLDIAEGGSSQASSGSCGVGSDGTASPIQQMSASLALGVPQLTMRRPAQARPWPRRVGCMGGFLPRLV